MRQLGNVYIDENINDASYWKRREERANVAKKVEKLSRGAIGFIRCNNHFLDQWIVGNVFAFAEFDAPFRKGFSE